MARIFSVPPLCVNELDKLTTMDILHRCNTHMRRLNDPSIPLKYTKEAIPTSYFTSYGQLYDFAGTLNLENHQVS